MFPSVNNAKVSYANIDISIEQYTGPPFRTADISGINFNDAVSAERVIGTGGETTGSTDGDYDANGDITLRYAAAIDLQNALKTSNPDLPLSRIEFDVDVSWTPQGAFGRLFNARLVGCRIISRDMSNAVGSAPAELGMTLFITRIEHDGMPLNEVI